MTKNVSLLTHGNCLDGSACAILFVAAGFNRKKVHFTYPGHEQVEEKLDALLANTGDDIILVDVGVSKEYADKCMSVERLYLLDHHKASVPLASLDWCEVDVDNKRCGSLMFYDWLLGKDIAEDRGRVRKYKNFLLAVDDRDRWMQEVPESESVATLHHVLGQKLFIDRFLKNPDLDLNSQETYAITLESEKRKNFVEKCKKNVFIRTFSVNGDNIRVGFVLSSTYQSEIGHAICNDLDLDVDVAAIVGLHKVCMRTKNGSDIDLSVIAALNGGGGHSAAASCPLGKVLNKDFLEMVASRLQWE